MAQIFLTYARRDLRYAKSIVSAFEKAGMTVWWDRRPVGGFESSPEIHEELEAAEAVVVLWSANATRSHNVHDEAGRGRDSGRLVQATLDGTDLPLGFRNIPTIDLSVRKRRDGTKSIDELLEAVAAEISETRTERIRKSRIPPIPPRMKQMKRPALIAAAVAIVALIAATLF